MSPPFHTCTTSSGCSAGAEPAAPARRVLPLVERRDHPPAAVLVDRVFLPGFDRLRLDDPARGEQGAAVFREPEERRSLVPFG